MKQHITRDDLSQLTPDQQDKLREWWQPKYYDVFYYKGNEYVIDGDVFDEEDIASSKNEFLNTINCLPLLSIGQCLSILERYAPMLGMKHGCYGPWYLEIWTEEAHRMFKDKECVDVCFQAVKEIL